MSYIRLHRFPVRTFLAPTIGMAAIAIVLGIQPTVSAQTQPAPTAVVDWVATEYAFTTPEVLPAGTVRIRLTNDGQEVHHGQLLRLLTGITFEQFTSALETEGQSALRFTSLEGGPGAVDPHATSDVTLDLKPGNYVLACFVPGPDGVPHLIKGMLKPLQVTTDVVPSGAAPEYSATLTMKDFSFDLPDTLPAGRATYRVVNAGPQPHELGVLKLGPGKTDADVLAWDSAPSGPPPFESVGGINGFSADGSGYMTLDFAPGEYLAVCHIPDPISGVAHLHLGMISHFSVQG